MAYAILILGQADQSLEHVPERPIVGAAAWQLEDLSLPLDDAGRVLGSGAAEVSAVSLVLDEDAGWSEDSPTKVPVSVTTDAKEGPWWIEDEEGLGELVQVEGIVAGEYLRLRSWLVRNYPAGSTIKPLTITASIDDAVTADEDLLEDKLRVVWSYEIEGSPRVHQELVKIARQQAGDGALSDVKTFAMDYFPELAQQLREDGSELDRWAQLARRLVQNAARAAGLGIDPAKLLAGPRAVDLLGFRLLTIIADNGLHPSQSERAKFRKSMHDQYTKIWIELTIGTVGEDAAELDKDGRQVGNVERSGLDFGW